MTIRAVVLLFLGTVSLSPLVARGQVEGSIQKTWDYTSGIDTLLIETDRQDIVVREGGPGVSGRLIGDSSDSVTLVRKEGRLTITVRTKRSWLDWRRKSSRVELVIPAGMNLDFTTASGSIHVGPAASLKARSASGDIEALGGREAEVSSASGNILLRDFSGPVTASSFSGSLRLERLSGKILANTLSGDLTGTDLKPDAGSRFTTTSGSVTVGLVSGPYAVRAESVSGRVVTGPSDSTGPSVLVQSVSGDVSVR